MPIFSITKTLTCVTTYPGVGHTVCSSPPRNEKRTSWAVWLFFHYFCNMSHIFVCATFTTEKHFASVLLAAVVQLNRGILHSSLIHDKLKKSCHEAIIKHDKLTYMFCDVHNVQRRQFTPMNYQFPIKKSALLRNLPK